MITLREYLHQARIDYVTAALAASSQCVAHAAALAHMHRTQMHRLIARLEITVDRGDKRYGNKGNEAWRALAEGRPLFDQRLSQRLSQMRQERLASMSAKCQHD